MEKFNPRDSDFKKVVDLPENERSKFVDFEDGFVRKDAADNYQDYIDKVKEENEKRSIFKKLFYFKQDVKARSHEKMLEDAIGMNNEIEDKNKDAVILKAYILKSFENIFNEQFAEYIKEGDFGLVISEDQSGRLPAEILFRIINKVNSTKLRERAELIGVNIGRSVKDDQKLIDILSDFSRRNTNELGVLYVTEFIDCGHSMDCAMDAFERAYQLLKSDNIKLPKVSVFLTMGARSKEAFDHDLTHRLLKATDNGLNLSHGNVLRDVSGYYKEFNGISHNDRFYSKINLEDLNKIREVIINEVVEEISNKYGIM